MKQSEKIQERRSRAKVKKYPSPSIKKRLEETVLEVFSEGDFHQADMRTIARNAEVSFETIYKYYGSKEQLLFSFVDEWLSSLTERIVEQVQSIEDTKEKIRTMFSIQLKFYEENPRVGIILYMTIPYKTWLTDKCFRQKKLIDFILGGLREGQENGSLNPNLPVSLMMDIIFGIVLRCFLMWIYRGKKTPLTDQTPVLFDMIWKAISNPDQDD